MLFGLPLPVCSCGVLPLYHSPVRRRPERCSLQLSGCDTRTRARRDHPLAALLGAPFTGVRVVAAALIAIVVGLIYRLSLKGRPRRSRLRAGHQRSVAAVWRTGFVDVLDETGPWIVFGLAVAALMAAELDLSGLASLPRGFSCRCSR